MCLLAFQFQKLSQITNSQVLLLMHMQIVTMWKSLPILLCVMLRATPVTSLDHRVFWERWLSPQGWSDGLEETKSNPAPILSDSIPSDAPSSIPSGTPSSIPSDTPSSLPSDTPSSIPSDTPTSIPSDTPTTFSQNVINEDAVQQGLDSLDLQGFSDVQSWSQEGGTLTDFDRQIPFSLENLMPYTEIFAPDAYRISDDGLLVTHLLTNETFGAPIFRSLQLDGTTIQIATNDLGNISFAEIRVPDPNLHNDTFFLPSEFLRDSIIGEDGAEDPFQDKEILLSFTSHDLDDEKLSNTFDLDDLEVPASNRHRYLSSMNHLFRRNAATESFAAGACDHYQIVKVAVVYDAALCSVYGSMAATRNRIISIAATASLAYERDMCVKLQLNAVYTPDSTCGGSSFTNNFYTPSACRGDRNLLDDFTNWIQPRRNALGIDRSALIHLFTGADKVTSTIGCAWTGGVRFCTVLCSMSLASE
jgi:Metallo-peptidase family M12